MGMNFKMIDCLSLLAVLVLMFSSGANMILRKIHIFVAVVFVIAMIINKINRKAIMVCICLISYILINSLFLNTAATDYKECILLSVRLIGCVVIASFISMERFKNLYIKVMIFLSILSLICFGLLLVGITLPGSVTINHSYASFYHVMSYGAGDIVRRYRNCGIFTEPGIYQIYLNFALLMLWSDKDMSVVKSRRIFFLFSITLLTTRSSMGYLVYALILLLYLIYRPEILKIYFVKKRQWGLVIIIGIAMIGILEMNSGIIMSFITSTNSWASRHDDTILTMKIAIDYPLFGIGLATNPFPIWDIYYEKFEYLRLYKAYQSAMSCGLGNYMCMGGIPFTFIYVSCIMKSYVNLFEAKDLLIKAVLLIIILLFLLEEPLMPTPFFLFSFFTCFMWRGIQNKENLYCKETNCEGNELC